MYRRRFQSDKNRISCNPAAVVSLLSLWTNKYPAFPSWCSSSLPWRTNPRLPYNAPRRCSTPTWLAAVLWCLPSSPHGGVLVVCSTSEGVHRTPADIFWCCSTSHPAADLSTENIINSDRPSRLPRWRINSGIPRILLVLVLEFESRRGEILNLLAKKRKKEKKKDQVLKARSVGKYNSTPVDEGTKGWNLSRDKMARHEPYRGGGGKKLLCDPGSEEGERKEGRR